MRSWRLLRGERVDMKTDWFELRGAKLQLENYTRPHIEMAVACARSPVGALAAWQTRDRHVVDWRHLR